MSAMTVYGATCTCPLHRTCRCGFHRRPCDCGGVLERVAAELLRCPRCQTLLPAGQADAQPEAGEAGGQPEAE